MQTTPFESLSYIHGDEGCNAMLAAPLASRHLNRVTIVYRTAKANTKTHAASGLKLQQSWPLPKLPRIGKTPNRP